VAGVPFAKKRVGYTKEEKAQCVEVVRRIRAEGKGRGVGSAVKMLRQVPGFEKIDGKQLRRWMMTPVVAKKRGRPVPVAFEAAVFDELV